MINTTKYFDTIIVWKNRFGGEQKQTKVFVSAQMRKLPVWTFKTQL